MNPRSRRTLRMLALVVGLAAIAVATVAIAKGGSGGSSSAAAAGPDNVTANGGSIEIATAGFPGGHDTDEVSATGSKPIPPCSLVPKKKAEAILGAGVTVEERPQGPTCVYSGSGREVDLVIEKVPLKSLKNGASSARAVTILDRSGWCLRYQETSVVIGVGAGRILQVTGACQAGVRFAAGALPRIPLHG
jgi:hypothetical protein